MRIDISHPFARYLDVIDLTTGQKLLRVRWADDEKGEYAQYPERMPGEAITKPNRLAVVKRGKIAIRFEGPDVQRRAFERYMNPPTGPTWPPRREDT